MGAGFRIEGGESVLCGLPMLAALEGHVLHEGSKCHGANSDSGSTSKYKIFDTSVDSIRPPEGVALGPETVSKKAQNSKINFESSKRKVFPRSN